MTSTATTETEAAQARKLIESMSTDRCYINSEIYDKLEKLDIDGRTIFQLAKEEKGQTNASPVHTPAKDLDPSSAKLLYELLHNAEENHYSEARKRDKQPFIAFRVHPDCIIIDSNADDLTAERLRALDDSIKSFNNGSQGCNNGKDINFKYSFMAAWKVHVQSGHYSISFQHRLKDSGVGMISSAWEDPDNMLPQSITRMKLLLHNIDGEARKSLNRETIRNQFYDLQENTLLFMRNLREIRISFFGDKNEFQRSTVFSANKTSFNRVLLTKTVTEYGQSKTTSMIYHVIRHTVDALDKNENLSYSELEEKTKAYSNTDIVLGFPLSEEYVPIIQYHKVFDLMPIGHAGFKFLIHSDFVTQRNRQGVVTTSLRNQGLLDGVVDAFIKAIQEFCQHSKLQYTWMRFLPVKNEYPYDTFWSQLFTKLDTKLRLTPVMRPRSKGGLRLISEIRNLDASWRDRHGNPLFRDLSPELYLSDSYTQDDLNMLKPYGLSCLDWNACINIIRQDLGSSPSRMMAKDTEDDWHTRSARKLIQPFVLPHLQPEASCLRFMRLIPLQEEDRFGSNVERFVSNVCSSIYFAETAGTAIPKGLGLKLVDTSAGRNLARADLFNKLGVCTAPVDFVRQRILDQHEVFRQSKSSASFTISHLEFLYTTHHLASDATKDYTSIVLSDHCFRYRAPHLEDVYLRDESPFGPQKLLEQTKAGKEPGQEAPGMVVPFIHANYFKDIPQKPLGAVDTWNDWLCSSAGLRRHLRLVKKDDPQSLSDECIYIAKYRPEKFLGFLSHHWPLERELIERSDALKQTLAGFKVACVGGGMSRLSETYLPLPDLQKQCARFLRGDEKVPFLDLDVSVERGSYMAGWGFLGQHLGVGVDEDLVFYLAILLGINRTASDDIVDGVRIFDLYNVIYGQYSQSTYKEVDQEIIREVFADEVGIFVPAGSNEENAWANLCDCLWEAPSSMRSKYPVKSRIEQILSAKPSEQLNIERLFCDILEIKDCDWSHITEELKLLKEEECGDFDRIHDLYSYLDNMMSKMRIEDICKMRHAFEEDALIYVTQPKKRWCRVSECLWSSKAAFQLMETLSDDYEDLQGFFVGSLGVRLLNFQVVYDELLRLGHLSSPSIDLVKAQLWQLNSLLENSSPLPETEPLLKACIFPVRQPELPACSNDSFLWTAQTDFVLVDRAPLESIFARQVNTLDFSLDEIRRLEPLLRWLKLDTRYLSKMVKEVSTAEDLNACPTSSPNRRIGRKARALYRVALHYNSPRVRGDKTLFNMLRDAQVFESERISSELQLSHNGKHYRHTMEKSDLHIREQDSRLEIFIPRDKKRQEFCYAKKLPSSLLEWMMTDPNTQTLGRIDEKALRIIASVLNSSHGLFSELLDDEGIASGDLEDIGSDEDDASEVEGSERTVPSIYSRSVTPDGSRATPSIETPESSLVPFISPGHRSSSSEEIAYFQMRAQIEASDRRAAVRFLSPSPRGRRIDRSLPSSPGYEPKDAETTIYRNLLSSIISASRSAAFPIRGSFDMSALQATLPIVKYADSSYDGLEQSPRYRTTSQQERDKKIGAAGELYVFELLKSLNPALPQFSRANWESTVRSLVMVHPDYATIAPWFGGDMEGIKYEDKEGALTCLLIEHGYLDRNAWLNARPNYLLEVKTTTGDCNAPFYMSKQQYRRMQEHHVDKSSVYVVFRVFNVEGSVGLKIYVDPTELKKDGGLVFTTETWSVAPAA